MHRCINISMYLLVHTFYPHTRRRLWVNLKQCEPTSTTPQRKALLQRFIWPVCAPGPAARGSVTKNYESQTWHCWGPTCSKIMFWRYIGDDYYSQTVWRRSFPPKGFSYDLYSLIHMPLGCSGCGGFSLHMFLAYGHPSKYDPPICCLSLMSLVFRVFFLTALVGYFPDLMAVAWL